MNTREIQIPCGPAPVLLFRNGIVCGYREEIVDDSDARRNVMYQSMKYTLERYNFRKGIYYGSVITNGTYDILSSVCDENLALTERELARVVKAFEEKVVRLLEEGNCVRIANIARIEPVIRGVFTGPEDVFDPHRHSVEAVLMPGEGLRQLSDNKEIRIKKINPARRSRRTK